MVIIRYRGKTVRNIAVHSGSEAPGEVKKLTYVSFPCIYGF